MLDFILLQPTQVSLLFFSFFKAGTPQQCGQSGENEKTFYHKHTWVTVALHSLNCFRANSYFAGTRHIMNMNHTQNTQKKLKRKNMTCFFHWMNHLMYACTPSIRSQDANSCETPNERPHHKIAFFVTFQHSSVKITFSVTFLHISV